MVPSAASTFNNLKSMFIRLQSYLLLALLLAPAAAAQPYQRVVDAFTVRDADGAAYPHPWLGGLNVPRPQLADLDGDGDADLLIQERAGTLLFFENTGTPASPVFTWRTDAFAGLAVGEWARLADLDDDGDLDVLAEEPFNRIRYYRNDGTAAAPRYVLAADTLRAEDGTAIFADRQNGPALADLDCDGDRDLFLATLDGTLTFYEHLGAEGGVPRFRFVSDRYQNLLIVGEGGKHRRVEERHGANAIAFADYDLDGDLDLFWGDFFSPSLYRIENTGSCGAPALVLASETFPPPTPLRTSGFNVPTYGDLDGDGRPDLVAGVVGGAFEAGAEAGRTLYRFRNTPGGGFERLPPPVRGLDVGEDSRPALGDLDGDGDLDLVVGNSIDLAARTGAELVFFRNEGTPTAPDLRLETRTLADLDGHFSAAPALGDLDGDGDLDLVVGGFDGTLRVFLNDGAAAFTPADAAALGLGADLGQNSSPALGDLDGDGDPDLVVGESAGTLNFFRNDGTASAPAFTLVDERFAGLDAGMRSAPALADLDGDGDPDLLVGTDAGAWLRLTNDAGTFAPAGAPGGLPPGLAALAPTAGDLDGDGDLDLLAGVRAGGVLLLRNARVATAAEPPDAAPVVEAVFVYPNPFAEAAQVQFELAQAGWARLTVYDVQGRAVAILVDAVLPAGRHVAAFDGRVLPAGLYLLRLVTSMGAAHGTMIKQGARR